MDNSDSFNPSLSPRTTLKLKNGARKSAGESRVSAPTPPIRESKAKPGSQWSDELKERMQADMDALTSRQDRR
jgi:hypothetical protein